MKVGRTSANASTTRERSPSWTTFMPAPMAASWRPRARMWARGRAMMVTALSWTTSP